MAKPVLRIAPNLSLPIGAITEVFGILAIRGVGKTYTQMKMAEEFIRNRLPVIALDSMGHFWGLRAAADGKGPGLPITIMGGDHGDVPLVPTAGKVVADLLARENLSCILDISDFRKNEQRRFVMEFLEEFYHLKKKYRDPVHLFMDESDLWAPQKPEKGYERLLGATEDIVRRGRARGIGATLATQRSAVLNKNVLSQISVLVALQMTAPQDIDTVDYWIKSTATKEGREACLKAIPSLEKGEAFVWSPAWLKIFKRVRIAERITFDSSRTPEIGERIREPKTLAPVDIKKVKAAIEATVEVQKSEDPRLLKAQLAKMKLDLNLALARATTAEQHLSKKPLAVVTPIIKYGKAVEIPVLKPAELVRFESIAAKLTTAAMTITGAAGNVRGHVDMIRERIETFDRQLKLVKEAKDRMVIDEPARAKEKRLLVDHVLVARTLRVSAPQQPLPQGNGIRLKAGEKAMLGAVHALGGSCMVDQIGTLTGFPARGATFKTYINVLKRNRLVVQTDKLIEITLVGNSFATAGDFAFPRTSESVIEMWHSKLKAGEKALLDTLIRVYPHGMSLERLGEESGITNPATLKTYVNVLKRSGIAEEKDSSLSASKTLFPGG